MKVSDFVTDFLINKGVTDVFGIPGGVILDFLDSVGKRKGKIAARLNYHEQASAFAACGYSQSSGKLAVAYATRGPGITNMVTGIADSFCDSLPVFYFTAHSHVSELDGIRIEENQEFDTVKMMTPITKYAVRIERMEDVLYELEKAYHSAVSGRPGPVLIDFLASVLKADIDVGVQRIFVAEDNMPNSHLESVIESIRQYLSKAKRPVLLLGDGIKQSETESYINKIADNWKIPVLSSRFAQDIISKSEYFFGYIGSHAMRSSNFILSKCDLIVSIGNRLMFNPRSESFSTVIQNAKIIRIDVDKDEFLREIPKSECFSVDLRVLMPGLAECSIKWSDDTHWLDVCKTIRDNFSDYDIDFPVNTIAALIQNAGCETIITSDVGNNEFWLCRAYALSGGPNRVLYSKSFGALGCSLPKAIGAYYAVKQNVLCFTGDQGLQMNIQELQFISQWKLPIKVVLINNSSSGMIRELQKKNFDSRYEAVDFASGYNTPCFEKIAGAFGINYYRVDSSTDVDSIKEALAGNEPSLIEIVIDEDVCGIPYLPKGNPPQNLAPVIDRKLYNEINAM